MVVSKSAYAKLQFLIFPFSNQYEILDIDFHIKQDYCFMVYNYFDDTFRKYVKAYKFRTKFKN